MDHQPFEEWLLSGEPLTTEQKRQLDGHLRKCSSCAVLTEVNLVLKSVRMAEPAAGFQERFGVRLAQKKQALRQRNIWGFIILGISVPVLFAGLSWPVLKELFMSPVNMLVSWISSLVLFWASLQAIVRAGIVLFKVVPGFVPSYIWMVVLFSAGTISLAWILSLMKFTKIPRGVS
jgi:hypothetical protein